jgi:glycerol-3-phosphate cytidylyltransferase
MNDRHPRCYVGGTFDLFHAGHVRLLSRASEIGPVTVSLNRDEFVARYKRQPVMSLAERFEVVASCMFIDHVIVNMGDEDSRPAILAAEAGIVAYGDDWDRPHILAQMGLTDRWLRSNQVELRELPYTTSVSTSIIIGRIEQRMAVAA